MVTETGVYDIARSLETERERLNKSGLDDNVRKAIANFVNYIGASGVTKHRQYFYMVRLRLVALRMREKFLDPSDQDLVNLINELQNAKSMRGEPYTSNTINDFKVALKRFYRWQFRKSNNKKDIDELLEALKKSGISSNGKSEKIITQAEERDMLAQCKNPRDKCYISLLYDSGCRISELLTLKIGDVQRDEYGLRLHVTGKTGERIVRAVGDSVAYFIDWIKAHPERDDNEAYLFIKLDQKNQDDEGNHEMMDYYSAAKVIRTMARKAGIKKNIHPHLFRHTRATLLARDLKEAPLEKVMGWAHGSDMTKHYVHLTDGDVDRAILKVYGIELSEDKMGSVEDLPRICERCDTVNTSDAKYCKRCALPLDKEVLQEMEVKLDEVGKVISQSKVIDPSIKAISPRLDKATRIILYDQLLADIKEDPEARREFIEELKKLL